MRNGFPVKILNFGALNVDHVYQVDHFIRPGETMSSLNYQSFCGGKGLNQSVALAYAGAQVYHAGKVGKDGLFLIDHLKSSGVITDLIRTDGDVTGHAIIQVDRDGRNCIILHGGANQNITENEISLAFKQFEAGDYLLLQNEINLIDRIIKRAREVGMKIVLNPSPMDEKIQNYPLDLVDIFIVNEIEGYDLTGKSEPQDVLDSMLNRFPNAAIVLTLGAKGVIFRDKHHSCHQPADTSVKVVDTTAAGDTFIGYFISCLAGGFSVEKALRIAAKACDICVSRPGASSSIPEKSELAGYFK